MHISYPTLTQQQINRQGELWWECDGADCDEQVHVEGDAVPEGWATSDPDDNPHNGASTFCPLHLGLAPLPQGLDATEYRRAKAWRNDNDFVNAPEVPEPAIGTGGNVEPSPKVPDDVFDREVLGIEPDAEG